MVAPQNAQPVVLQQAQIADDAGNLQASQALRDQAGNYAHLGEQFQHLPFDPAGGTE